MVRVLYACVPGSRLTSPPVTMPSHAAANYAAYCGHDGRNPHGPQVGGRYAVPDDCPETCTDPVANHHSRSSSFSSAAHDSLLVNRQHEIQLGEAPQVSALFISRNRG